MGRGSGSGQGRGVETADGPYSVTDDGDRLVCTLRWPRWLRVAWLVLVLLVVLTPLVRWLGTGELRPGASVAFAVLPLLLLLQRAFFRVSFTVDAGGVDLRRRRQRMPWERVASVDKPGPFSQQVVLRLEDGMSYPTVLPPHLARRVAEIGRRPLLD